MTPRARGAGYELSVATAESPMVHSTRARPALLAALLMVGVATTAGAASIPVTMLSHNVDGTNWAVISADVLTSLSSQDADIMSL